MNISITQIQTIVDTTTEIGATVPGDLTKAIADASKVRESANNISTTRNELAIATIAAIKANRDPATDKEVNRILNAQALSDGIPRLVSDLADADVLSALQGSVDDLIEAWQPRFNAAVSDIAAAASRLGNTPLEDAAGVLTMGGDAAEQWAKATKANRTITQIIDAWTLLAHQTGFVSPNRRWLVMKHTAPTLGQWEELNLIERKLSAWEAYHLGLKLELATRISYPQRINALTQQQEDRELRALHAETGKNAGASMMAAR